MKHKNLKISGGVPVACSMAKVHGGVWRGQTCTQFFITPYFILYHSFHRCSGQACTQFVITPYFTLYHSFHRCSGQTCTQSVITPYFILYHSFLQMDALFTSCVQDTSTSKECYARLGRTRSYVTRCTYVNRVFRRLTRPLKSGNNRLCARLYISTFHNHDIPL